MRKFWWATAPLAVGLMIAASSQPYFGIYRPWSWTQEHTVEAETAGSFSFPVYGYESAKHTADIEVLGFQEVEREEDIGLDAPDGFTIWAVLTEWKAPEDSVLSHCEMWFLGSDGKEYIRSDSIFGGVGINENLSANDSCTPPGETGPEVVAEGADFDDFVLEPGTPRPETWRKVVPIAMPDGVQPEKVYFGWNKPHYVALVLPEPKNYVDGASEDSAES